jgi:hypothetical protein
MIPNVNPCTFCNVEANLSAFFRLYRGQKKVVSHRDSQGELSEV